MRENFITLEKKYTAMKKLEFSAIMVMGVLIILASTAIGYSHEKEYN